MENKIQPKLENANVGFHYHVTDEQIAEYAKWSLEERFSCIFQTAKFIYEAQTPVERAFSKKIKGKNTDWK